MSQLSYQLLHVFNATPKWRKYSFSQLSSFTRGDVVEVGAGIGENIPYIKNIKYVKKLILLEPNRKYYNILKKKFKKDKAYCSSLSKINRKFDTIIYFDVLEHIKNSKKEIEIAESKLKKGGKIIILCPAFNFLYNEFDREVGHYLRYDKKSFYLIKKNLKIEKIFFIDSIGFLLQLINKFFLKRLPNKKNIKIWDCYLIISYVKVVK